MTWLFEAGEVIHARDRTINGEPKDFFGRKREGIFSVEQDKSFGGKFLVIISGDAQWKFGGERQHATQAIGAEAIRSHAVAGCDADSVAADRFSAYRLGG